MVGVAVHLALGIFSDGRRVVIGAFAMARAAMGGIGRLML